jgi:quercetin dioxygenase-like cupin family protein
MERRRKLNKKSETQESLNIPAAEALRLAELVDYQKGSIVSREVLKNKAGTITAFAFDEGQGLSEHAAPFDAFVQILEGTADITIGGEKKEVAHGEIIIMPANVPHALHAEAKFKMLLVMIRG